MPAPRSKPSIAATLWVGLSALLLGSGCRLLKSPIPPVENPVMALSEVALIPVGAHDVDNSQQWTQQLHQALLHVDGIQRVHVLPAVSAADTKEFLKSSHRCLLEVNVLPRHRTVDRDSWKVLTSIGRYWRLEIASMLWAKRERKALLFPIETASLHEFSRTPSAAIARL